MYKPSLYTPSIVFFGFFLRGVYKTGVPNQRSDDQVFTPLWMRRAFLRLLDLGCTMEDMNRSQFMRKAVKEKLSRLGIEVPEEVATAPIRAGKGGPKRISYRTKSRAADLALKEAEISGLAQIGGKRALEELGLSQKAASTTDKSGALKPPAHRAKDARRSPVKPVPAESSK